MTSPSLTRRVLSGVLLPLALTWLVGTGVAIGIANYLTEQAFDHAMLDDAHSVAANVQVTGNGIELLLSPREVTTVLFDQVESVYFAVLRPDGSLLAGSPGLQAPAPQGAAEARFSDIVFQGQALRAVVLKRGPPHGYEVVIAQTTRARASLVGRLLSYALTPQLILLSLLALWVWRRVGADLRPLGELQQALDRRDARDLAPVAVAHTSREVERLGNAVNALFDRLGHSVSAQREFAGNVAHELRTPLAGIRALAEYGLAQSTPGVWRENSNASWRARRARAIWSTSCWAWHWPTKPAPACNASRSGSTRSWRKPSCGTWRAPMPGASIWARAASTIR